MDEYDNEPQAIQNRRSTQGTVGSRQTTVKVKDPRESTVSGRKSDVKTEAGDDKTKPDGKESKKKRAQELAAQREQELAHRNANYVMQYLQRKTRFDKDQIRALMKIYKCFKGNYQMDRLRFREMVASVFGITDNIMLDRIFQAFDGDNQGSVSETEWIIGLSIQLQGTLDEQIAYTYDVYDINGDRALGRDEIHNCLRGSFSTIPGVMEPEELDDSMNELVEIAMRKFDINHDGNIKFPEFRHIIKKDPLLLEAFGECLPNDTAAVPFVALLDQNPRNYKCYLSRPGDSAWTKERDRYNHHHHHHGHGHPHQSHHEGYEDEEESLPSGSSNSPLLWSMSTVNGNHNDNEVKKVAYMGGKNGKDPGMQRKRKSVVTLAKKKKTF